MASRKVKIIIISFVLAALVAVTWFYLIPCLAFTGAFDTKYTREELTRNFTEHEKDFQDVVDYFNSHLPSTRDYSVYFSNSGWNKYSLYLRPVSGLVNNFTGGTHLVFNSSGLDSALNKLGWTNETLLTLKEKLAKTKCDHIMTADVYGGCDVELAPYQNGWGSFSYMVYDTAMSDTLIKQLGKPINTSAFGSRVRLSYSSAL